MPEEFEVVETLSTGLTDVSVMEINPVSAVELANIFREIFLVDITLIGFSVVGSIAAFATFWALRGR